VSYLPRNYGYAIRRSSFVLRRPGVTAQGMGDFSSVASVIQTIEGWFPGSLSQTNNNPGNLRPAGQPGCTPVGGFCSFTTLAAGQQALNDQIALDASRGETIAQFAAKYAPAQDSNDPASYAASIAAATGLSVNDPLSLADSSVVTSVPTSGIDLSSLFPDVPPSPSDGSGDSTLLYVGLGLAAGAVALMVLS